MKKIYLLLGLVLLSSCAVFGNRFGTYRQLSNNTGKISYTKKASICRPFLFGNPSIAQMAKDSGISEVVTIEDDFYIIANCVTIRGN